MDLTTRFGAPFGAPALPSAGYTEEQLAERESVLNAPIPPELLGFNTREITTGLGDSYASPYTGPTTSLGEYESSHVRAAQTAGREDSIFGAVGHWALGRDLFPRETYAADPDFNPNNHLALYDLVSSEYYDELNEAQSQEELVARVQYYGRISRDGDYLDNMGAEGIGYRVAMLLGDVPLTNGLSILRSLPMTARVAEVAERTYMGRALVAGLTEGSLEGVKLALAPHSRDEADILLAVGLGGALGGIYRPSAYANGVQEALMNPVRDVAEDVAANGGRLVRTPPSTVSTLDRLQVNVATVLRTSESPTLSRFGDEAFLDVTRAAPSQVKAAEVQTAVIDGIQSEFNRRFTPLYQDFLRESQGTALASRYRISSQDDFYELAGKIANQPNRNWDEVVSPDLVARIRQANTEMGEAAHDVLQRNGHSRFLDGSIARGEYLPRRWNRAKLLEDINLGVLSRADAEGMFSQGIRNAVKSLGYDITEDKVLEAGKKFVQSLTRKQVRSGDPNFIMEDNAFRKAIDDVQQVLNLGDDEARMLEEALQNRRNARGAQEGTASATRRRGDVDVEAKYLDANGVEHNLSDYLENNVQSLWMSYSRQMGGDTALRSMGIESRPQLAAFRSTIVDELTDASGQISSRGQRELANFDAVIGDFLNISGKHNPDSDLWKLTRTVNNLTRASKLGATWFAMSAELAQVVATNGLVSVMKAVPELGMLPRALKGPKAREIIDEIQSFYSLGDEVLQMPSAARLDEMYQTSTNTGRLSTLEAFSDRAAEAAYMLGGTKSGTSALETLFAASANNRIARMAGKQRLSANDRWMLDQMGFRGAEEQSRLLDLVRSNASADNRFVLNLDNWADPETAQRVAYGMRRMSHIAIQRGNIGDQMGRFTAGGTLIKDSMLGSMGMNLRNYMMTAWNKQFSRMAGQIGRGGEEAWVAYKNMMYQMVIVGGLGYMGKQGLNYVTGAIDDEEFAERTSPQAIVANTFNMTTFASLLPIGMDAASQFATGETMSGRPVRGGSTRALGASAGYVTDLYNTAMATGKLIDPDRDITEYETRRALGLLPLSTMIGVSQGLDILAEGIAGD